MQPVGRFPTRRSLVSLHRRSVKMSATDVVAIIQDGLVACAVARVDPGRRHACAKAAVAANVSRVRTRFTCSVRMKAAGVIAVFPVLR